jgi:hypothetical protein
LPMVTLRPPPSPSNSLQSNSRINFENGKVDGGWSAIRGCAGCGRGAVARAMRLAPPGAAMFDEASQPFTVTGVLVA